MTSQGAILSYKKSGQNKYTELEYPQGWSGFGGEPDKLETTTLKNKVNKTYEDGLIDPGALTFPSLYNKEEYYELKALENEVLDWKFKFPDGSGYKFSGKPKITRDDKNFNEVMNATLKITPTTDIEDLEEVDKENSGTGE